MTHRADVRELLQDLADASQPRFRELEAQTESAEAFVDAASRVPVAGSMFAQALAPLTASQQWEHVEAEVLRVVRELTGAAASSVAAETPLMEAGVDSLAATELSLRLRALTGVPLSRQRSSSSIRARARSPLTSSSR